MKKTEYIIKKKRLQGHRCNGIDQKMEERNAGT